MHDPQLVSLLLTWEERRAAGQSVTPEDLCRDRPDLLAAFRAAITGLDRLESHLADEGATLPGPAVAPPTAALTWEGTFAERYADLRPLAEGGIGEVYVATDVRLNRPVAVKVLRAEAAWDADRRRRFDHEAAVTARLNHPGVAPVLAAGPGPDGRPCYVMRLIEGETLADAITRLHAAGPVDYRGAAFRHLLQRFGAVCATVAYAHSRGVIHRDLKPANVMLGPFGETLVVDWGLAKVVTGGDPTPPGPPSPKGGGEEIGSVTLGDSSPRSKSALPPSPLGGGGGGVAFTREGDVLGTPAFMSPEQALGDPVGPAADAYGLGATLFALLVGEPPLTGEVADVIVRLLSGKISGPRDRALAVPPALDAICRKAMAADPGRRYANPLEVQADLDRWAAGEPVTAYPEPWPDRAARWAGRHRGPVLGLAMAAATALVAWAVAQGEVARQQEAAARVEADLRRQAEADRDAARTQKERVRANLTDLLSGDALVFLTAQPKLLPGQRAFLERAARHLDDATGDAADVPTRLQLLTTLGRLRLWLGDLSGSQAAFRQAVAGWDAWVAERPQDEARVDGRAACLAFLAQALGRAGDPAAEAALRRAVADREALLRGAPAAPARQVALGQARNDLGAWLTGLGRPTEAAAAYRASVDLLAGRDGDGWAVAAANLAYLEQQAGRPVEAARLLQAVVAYREQAAAAAPAEPLHRCELAAALARETDLLRATGRGAAAEAQARRARDLIEGCVQDQPGIPRFRRQLALQLTHDGMYLRKVGQAEAAATTLTRAVAVGEQLLEQTPADYEVAATLARAANARGCLRLDQGQVAEAEADLRRTTAVLTSLRPRPAEAADLGGVYCNLAALEWKRGHDAEGLAWAARAVAVLTPVAEGGAVPVAQKYLTNTFWYQALMLDRQRRPAEALAVWDRAVPRAPEQARPLFALHRAACLARLGRLAEALEVAGAYRTAGLTWEEGYLLAVIHARAAAAGAEDPDGHARRAAAYLRQAAGQRPELLALARADEDFRAFWGKQDFGPLPEGQGQR